MPAQVTATAPPLSNELANYNNRWDAYGGFGYARFQTTLGVNLKTNMYGWKGQVTGWLNPIVGLTAGTGNYYGTVSLPPNQYDLNNASISEHMFLFGPEFRLLRDPKWTVDVHVLLGGTYGIFNKSFPSTVQPNVLRLYNNQLAFAVRPADPLTATSDRTGRSASLRISSLPTMGWPFRRSLRVR